MQVHADRNGGLSDLSTGPILKSGLELKPDDASLLTSDRWSAEDYYIEIHGDAPEYKGTIIYAKGSVWPYSGVWCKDYCLIINDLTSDDAYEVVERWSE